MKSSLTKSIDSAFLLINRCIGILTVYKTASFNTVWWNTTRCDFINHRKQFGLTRCKLHNCHIQIHSFPANSNSSSIHNNHTNLHVEEHFSHSQDSRRKRNHQQTYRSGESARLIFFISVHYLLLRRNTFSISLQLFATRPSEFTTSYVARTNIYARWIT